MAKTIEQLKAQGAEVKNATVVGENTATRVGTLFTDIVEHVEQYETGQTADTEANTLAINNEAQARAKADEQLNTAIVAEKNRAEAAEKAIIFDVSKHNNGAVFESLKALLSSSNLSTLIPTSFRHGGMTIKFIQGSEQSSDNKYVRYNYLLEDVSTAATFTNVNNWQGVDKEVITESHNLVESGGVAKALKGVSHSYTGTLDEAVEIVDGETVIFSATGDGVNAKNLKSNNVDLLNAINGKVSKVEGKGLSTEDYTSQDKSALQNIRSKISFDNASDLGEEIRVEDGNGNPIISATENGVDAKNLKSNGKNVLTEDIISEKTVPHMLDDRFVFQTNANESVAEIDGDGIKAKEFFDMDGNPMEWYKSASKRYIDKTGVLTTSARYNVGGDGAKDLQLLLITDIHNDKIPSENAVSILNSFSTIDAILCMGDICGSRYLDNTFKEEFNQIMAGSEKPYYVCVGNHDVGNAYYVGYCATHQQEYNTFIKPIVDLGYLSNTEYEEGKAYYYHDFANRNIRLIVINEYDDPLDFDEQYWKAVQYSDSYSSIALNHAYSVGDKVNVPNYTEYSFECVQGVTTPSFIGDSSKGIIPSYKIRRGYRVIRQAQAQWFLDTLCSTPTNYSVVVMVHGPFSANTTNQKTKKFAQNVDATGGSYLQNCMETDFIADAINAFVNGNNYSEDVVMSGEASYLNTQGSGTYAYSVQKNFANKNTGVKFLCYIGGHCHRDLIFKHNSYAQYEVSPICAVTNYAGNSGNDIKRKVASVYGNGFGVDSLTCISFDSSGKVRLVKIGEEVTTDMDIRDVELLNLAQ